MSRHPDEGATGPEQTLLALARIIRRLKDLERSVDEIIETTETEQHDSDHSFTTNRYEEHE